MKLMPTIEQLLEAMSTITYRLDTYYPIKAEKSCNIDPLVVDSIRVTYVGEYHREYTATIANVERWDDVNQCFWVIVNYSDFPVALEFLKPFNPFA